MHTKKALQVTQSLSFTSFFISFFFFLFYFFFLVLLLVLFLYLLLLLFLFYFFSFTFFFPFLLLFLLLLRSYLLDVRHSALASDASKDYEVSYGIAAQTVSAMDAARGFACSKQVLDSFAVGIKHMSLGVNL